MDSSIRDLKNKLQEQEKKIGELECMVIDLNDYVLRLSICKETNPKYPYYNLIVLNQISYTKKATIESLFLLLSYKISEGGIPQNLKRYKFKGSIYDFLESDKPLQYKDIEEVMIKILEVESKDVPFRFIKAMKEQGIYSDVCTYLLEQVNPMNFKTEDFE